MKTPLPPSLVAALSEVADIADNLAMTACDFPSAKFGDMNIAGVLDNLDHVASCLTLAELEDAPAKLMTASRAFRQTFPFASLGWYDADRLQRIANMIEQEKTAAAARTTA